MIAIKGMKMPKGCFECERGSICGYRLGYRPDDCPLVEIEERKVGKWINKSHTSDCGIKFVASECTCCGKKTFFDCDQLVYNYCPNCGAKMLESQESEDKE